MSFRHVCSSALDLHSDSRVDFGHLKFTYGSWFKLLLLLLLLQRNQIVMDYSKRQLTKSTRRWSHVVCWCGSPNFRMLQRYQSYRPVCEPKPILRRRCMYRFTERPPECTLVVATATETRTRGQVGDGAGRWHVSMTPATTICVHARSAFA